MREKRRLSKIPKPNVVDRALTHIAPSFAMKRYKNRCIMAMADSYIGGSKKRRSMSQWSVPDGDFDTAVLPELSVLRDRSQNLFNNNMLAAGAINTKVTSVVGGGLVAHPRIDAKVLGLSDEQADKIEAQISREWRLWSNSKHCTVNKKLNFRETQSLALLSTLVRGDTFALTPEADATPYMPYRLRVQLVEADRVCNKNNATDTPTLSGGIEVNSDGSLKNVHIMKGHPGNPQTDQATWHEIPFYGEKTGRRNVLHLYRNLRCDQSRGVPDLAPVMEGLKQFSTLTQATIDAAVIQTMLSVFIETPEGEGPDLPAGDTSTSGSETVKLESAAIIDLAEGEIPHVVDPTQPNSNFAAFAKEFYTQLGTAIQVPHELLVKHFQSSYSAAQAALLEAWRFFMTMRSWLADNYCQPVYEIFLAEAVASGRVVAPGFFNDPIIRAAYSGADWVGPPRGHIRDDVQNKADGYAEDRGWKTGAQNAQERGGDWERNHRQRVKEITLRRQDGVITTSENDGVEDIVKVDE